MPKIRRSKELPGAITIFGISLLVGGAMIAVTGIAVQEFLTAQAALKLTPTQENTRFYKASIVETNSGEISKYYQFKGGQNLVADTTYAVPIDSLTQAQAVELAGQELTVSIAPQGFGIGGRPDHWLLGITAEGTQYLNPADTREIYVKPKRQRLYWVWIFAAGGVFAIYIGGKVLIFHLT
jgi:hypothetical protein